MQDEGAEEAEADVDGDDEHGAARQSTPEDGPAAHRLGGQGLGSADRRSRHVDFLRAAAAAIEAAGDEQPQACSIKTRPRHGGFLNNFLTTSDKRCHMCFTSRGGSWAEITSAAALLSLRPPQAQAAAVSSSGSSNMNVGSSAGESGYNSHLSVATIPADYRYGFWVLEEYTV